jgi:hypothetical protein
LKPLAKAALPIAGRALGAFGGGPVGGMIGGIEVERRFVQFAPATTKNALSAPPAANP